MRDVKLNLRNVEDLLSQDNFERIKEYLLNQPFTYFKGKHYELTVSNSGTWQYPHNLGFIPEDVIQTYVSSGTVTWNYSSFDKTNIDFTTTAACTIRAFIGRYKEQ